MSKIAEKTKGFGIKKPDPLVVTAEMQMRT